jgi:hypothetical protein
MTELCHCSGGVEECQTFKQGKRQIRGTLLNSKLPHQLLNIEHAESGLVPFSGFRRPVSHPPP